MFQPIRPLLRWSSVLKRRASANGCSYVVLAVTPNASRSVCATSAGISIIGSFAGASTAHRTAASDDPPWTSYRPSTSAKNSMSRSACSAVRARFDQNASVFARSRSSAGWVHRLGAPPQPTPACS